MLNLIQNELCHPKNVILIPGPLLYCQVCQKNVLNIYEYCVRPSSDYFRSSEVAQAYFAWTGDTQVPMNFVLLELEGIFPKVVVGQTLRRVHQSIRLLKALNAPFLHPKGRIEDLYCDDMNTFLMDFLNIIHEHPQPEANNTRIILESLIQAMHDLLKSSKESFHPFQTYWNTLVPFVQQCVPNWQPMASPEQPQANLALELMVQMKISNDIRKHFGPYSIPLDVMHVMVNCFVCSNDMDVVGNWVLDFVARVCRGQFFWKHYPTCPNIEHMNKIIHQEISYRKHTDFFHQVLKPLRKGESAHHYSTLLKPFHELQIFLHGKFSNKYDDVKEMAFNQAFPAVCFEESSDQLGFMMGWSHILQTLHRNNGHVPKGTFKTAKTIHEKVIQFVKRVQEFDAITIQWTVDTFQMFLLQYPDFEQDIISMIETLMEDHNKDGTHSTKFTHTR